MVRERATTSSSCSSRDDCSSLSSSSSSEGSSSTSSSPSSCSSSSGDDAKSSSYKRSRRRSLSSRSRSGTNREFLRKHNRKEHASCERGKKRRKLCSNVESNGKSEKKREKRRSKKRKSYVEMEDAKRVSSKERKTHKLHEFQSDSQIKEKSNNLLEAAMNAQEQQKALIRHNAELAKARLESGELQRARDEQRKMHQLYGTVDWRANKKLRTEKKILERTVAAGKRLASLEQREYARMDAFRVALGLPTAEAQRQAEWRREATQALAELENGSKPAAPASNNRGKKPKQGLIGPMLPP